MLAVVSVMLQDPTSPWYGLALAEETGVRSGTVYPILARLERDGWLTSSWEPIDPAIEGRPRRRLYRLTALGEVAARDAREAQLRSLHVAPRVRQRVQPT